MKITCLLTSLHAPAKITESNRTKLLTAYRKKEALLLNPIHQCESKFAMLDWTRGPRCCVQVTVFPGGVGLNAASDHSLGSCGGSVLVLGALVFQ